MRKLGGLIFTLAFLFASAPARAATGDVAVRVAWDCPNTLNAEISFRPITIRYNGLTGAGDASELKTFLDSLATRYPGRDFHDCAQAFAEKAFDKLQDACGAVHTVVNWVLPKADEIPCRSRDAYASVMEATYAYSSGAFARGAVPHFEPAGFQRAPLGRDAQGLMRRQLGQFCAGSTEAPGQDFLDGEFLESLEGSGVGENPECREKLRQAFVNLLEYSRMSREGCERNPVLCVTRTGQISRAAALLAKAGLGGNFERIAIPPSVNACDNSAALSSMYEKQETWFAEAEAVRKVGECVSPKVGDPIRWVNGDVGTGVPATYGLKRTGKKSYQVALNLVFLLKNTEPMLTAAGDRVESCFRMMNGRLKGPKGETIELVLSNEAPVRVVTIEEKFDRANSERWKKDVSCTTILHETMHHLGLVDEYREYSIGYRLNAEKNTYEYVEDGAGLASYDCRIEGPDYSIMSNHVVADSATSDFGVVKQCCCLQSSDALRPVGSRGTACPLPAAGCETGLAYSWGEEQFINRERPPPKGQVTAGGACYVTESSYRPRQRESLLMPAQFRAITNPGCQFLNPVYLRCARESYKTSKARFGEGCRKDLPPECLKARVYGGETGLIRQWPDSEINAAQGAWLQ